MYRKSVTEFHINFILYGWEDSGQQKKDLIIPSGSVPLSAKNGLISKYSVK